MIAKGMGADGEENRNKDPPGKRTLGPSSNKRLGREEQQRNREQPVGFWAPSKELYQNQLVQMLWGGQER